jgi:hypothetical protein
MQNADCCALQPRDAIAGPWRELFQATFRLTVNRTLWD